ncbi:TPA: Hsp20/alpha crystallin family protein [Staphylococcus aureus]|nr:Hsp20/alpha crystallin family protein [Staphylococcus aureus]
MILNFNQFENQNFFNGNPSDTFKDLGKQVFNYFSTPSFVTNIYETDELYYLEAELAGVNKEDISIDFNNNTLTIQATRSAKYKSEQLIFEAVDKQHITASFENGLLTITLPKIKPSNETTSSTSIPIS